MRKILFRGKRVDNGEWVCGYIAKDQFKGKLFIITDVEVENVDSECADLYATEWFEVIPETVGEFTGYQTKDKKLVFEGDILKVTERRGNTIVGFGQISSHSWTNTFNHLVKFNSSDLQLVGFYTSNYCECEIIGNLHDNPELLGGKS